MAGEIRTLFIDGPVGRLEALLNTGEADATHAALVCHPHPMFGGTMHNKVVYNAMKAINAFGIPCLRFNFRGAMRSEGVHDNGRGEVDDVRAALDWLHNEFHLPLLFAGFSFGAATGMRAACPDERVKGLIALGLPVHVQDRFYSYEFLSQCTKPKLFISGDQDQYSPSHELEQVFAGAAEPKKLIFVPGAEHFFEGKLDQMQRGVTEWVEHLFEPARQEEAS